MSAGWQCKCGQWILYGRAHLNCPGEPRALLGLDSTPVKTPVSTGEKLAGGGRRRQKKRFLKLTVDGTSCICEPDEAADMMDDPTQYTVSEVWMTQKQYDKLPEFEGW